ncbi:MAG: S53 family peptidase [Ferruginibacter sp.]
MKNSSLSYNKLPGSEKHAPAAKLLDTINPNEVIEVTVRIRRKESIEKYVNTDQRFTREEYSQKFGSSDDDISKIEKFASDFHLMMGQIEKGRRSISLKGKISDIENAFQVHLANYVDEKGKVFRGRTGSIHIPATLQNIIEGVFGLDSRSHARPMSKLISHEDRINKPVIRDFTPVEISKIYKFPTRGIGTGQCIAIIALGGGFRKRDLKKYFEDLGMKEPNVIAVSVDRGHNKPSTADSDDSETMLDIEVAAAIAPGAKIVVYFAPNTDEGFLNAITTALHDTHFKPSVISISWGESEKKWTAQSLNSFNEAFKAASLLGVTICAAAGDGGSADGKRDGKVHADFPASSPFVLACGGTRLIMDGKKIAEETVWNESHDFATGGGVSEHFAIPEYQLKTKIPVSVSTGFKGRGLPDVAANADRNTGYRVRIDGDEYTIGGTSAVAPLMAGLVALLNEQRKRTVGFINPVLYKNPGLCRDITVGHNITTITNKGYKAGVGWDACTGWGVLSNIPKSVLP